MTLTHVVLAVFMYLVFVFGGAWYATRPVKSKRGSVRIVCYTEDTWPYMVQRYGFWGWYDGKAWPTLDMAIECAKASVAYERGRRAKPPPPKGIAEYEP